ncbi:MAG: DUF4277 domain-containing protein [Alteromonadaceae bacterium]|nr:DUF4277 domain-containing protein [Alteromonadaceae bacterium]
MTYQYSSKNSEHHGLVAGFCKEINLAQILDQALGGADKRTISLGNYLWQ